MKFGKRLIDKVLESVSNNDAVVAYYTADLYATVFNQVLGEKEAMKVNAIVMMIKDGNVNPLSFSFGFTVKTLRDEFTQRYGMMEWNKIRLQCATAMSKRKPRKKKK
jgi:hypothetical protein